jgi:helix-turn-helix protein
MSRKKPARKLLPGPERDKVAAELKAQYEAGTSIRAIAKATGRSYGGVHQLLAGAGVQFRSRGVAARDATASTDAAERRR